MFDHIGLFVSDLEASLPLYEACFEPLGIRIFQRQPELGAVIFSGEADVPFLWIGSIPKDEVYYGTKLKRAESRPMHVAFRAPTIESVKAFHRLGLEHGAKCNGVPEDCGRGYFAAYLLDLDGNNIEAGIRTLT